MGENFCEFRVLEKNYTQKTKIYMVHTLFLIDSQKFNPTKYTTYTVIYDEAVIMWWHFHAKHDRKSSE